MHVGRLAALGALAVCGGVALLTIGLAWLTRPTPTGGMDVTSAIVTWIAVGGTALAIIAVHLALARQLWDSDRPTLP